jgi:hypothetical protein
LLPFFQGLEKVRDDFSLYYSTFYERNSLEHALKFDLTETNERRQFLYIASHGLGKRAGNINIGTMLRIVKKYSRNIEGLYISSCEVGSNIEDFKDALIDSNIVWIVGYKCEISWLDSTLLEVAVMNELMDLGPSKLVNREKIFKSFKKAFSTFNGNHNISIDGHTHLRDAISLIIQPTGKGNKPKDMVEEIGHIFD